MSANDKISLVRKHYSSNQQREHQIFTGNERPSFLKEKNVVSKRFRRTAGDAPFTFVKFINSEIA